MTFASRAATVTFCVLLFMPAVTAGWPAPGATALLNAIIFVSVLVLTIWACASQRQARRRARAVDVLAASIERLRNENSELRRTASEHLEERLLLFASASHDLGQRLHAARLLAHSVLGDEVSAQNPQLVALSQVIDDLAAYARDVLEIARVDSQIVTPRQGVVHIQDVFQRLALQFESVAYHRGVTLRFRTSRAEVHTDERALIRVLENLISNAIKFTRDGVLVAARCRSGTWCIEVWDQGRGIPQGSLDAIFEPFYQNSAHLNRRLAGVGLGLAIVKRLAEGAGYTLQVASREGRGSVFKVLLPRDPAPLPTRDDAHHDSDERRAYFTRSASARYG